MKRTCTIICTILALIGAGAYLMLSSSTSTSRDITVKEEVGTSTPTQASFLEPALGLSFTYPQGKDGFVLERTTDEPLPDLVERITLTPTEDYEAFVKAPLDREGPQHIAIRVFKNTEKLSPSVWSMRHTEVTNESLSLSEKEESVVGGANAVRFVTDGLYATRVTVIAHGGFIYVVSGGYTDEASLTFTGYDALLSSMRFIETTATKG